MLRDTFQNSFFINNLLMKLKEILKSKNHINKGRIKAKYLSRYILDETRKIYIVDILSYDVKTERITIYPFIKINDLRIGFGYRKKRGVKKLIAENL